MKAANRSAASESEDRDQFEWFAERFDSADSILVSWPGCRLDDTRLDRFAEAVRRQMHSGEPAGGNWFLGIVTGRENFAGPLIESDAVIVDGVVDRVVHIICPVPPIQTRSMMVAAPIPAPQVARKTMGSLALPPNM